MRGQCSPLPRQFPDPTPGPGEVVIAMRASGMCGSDLHAYDTQTTGKGVFAFP